MHSILYVLIFCQVCEHLYPVEDLEFSDQTAVRLLQLRLSCRNQWQNARTLAADHGFDEHTVRALLGDSAVRALLERYGANVMEDRLPGAFDEETATTGYQMLPPELPLDADILRQFVTQLRHLKSRQLCRKRDREAARREAEYGTSWQIRRSALKQNGDAATRNNDDSVAAEVHKLLGSTIELRSRRLVKVLQKQHVDVLAACLDTLLKAKPDLLLRIVHDQAAEELDALSRHYLQKRGDDDYMTMSSARTTSSHCPIVWRFVRHWLDSDTAKKGMRKKSKTYDSASETNSDENANTLKDSRAVHIIDQLIYARKQQRLVPPTVLHLSTLLALGHTSHTVREILCQLGVATSVWTTRHHIAMAETNYLECVTTNLRSIAASGRRIFLAILDNYNVLRWAKRALHSGDFTHITPSISLLVRPLPAESTLDENSDIPACIPLDFRRFRQLLSQWPQNAWCWPMTSLPCDTRSVHLHDFQVCPSMDARSSSDEDFATKVFRFIEKMFSGVSEEECDEANLHEACGWRNSCMLVLDPEMLLVATKFATIYPQRARHLIFTPPTFHIRKHLIEDICGDTVYHSLFLMPLYYEVLNLNKKAIIQATQRPAPTTDELYDLDTLNELVAKFEAMYGSGAWDCCFRTSKARRINYARQFFVVQLIAQAASEHEVRSELERLKDTNWVLRTFAGLLESLRDVAMLPFSQIILDGDPQLFLSNFPKYIGTAAYKCRWKIVRSLVALQLRLDHYQQHRPDILEAFCKNCRSSNDNFIENFNSLLSRSISTNRHVTFESIQRASMHVSFFGAALREIRDALGMAARTSRSEPEREELLHMQQRYCATRSAVSNWIIRYARRLATVRTSPTVEYYPEPWLHANVLDWTEQMVSNYEKYIARHAPRDLAATRAPVPSTERSNRRSSVAAPTRDGELCPELEARLQAQQEETAVLRQLAQLLERFQVQLPEGYQGEDDVDLPAVSDADI